MAITNQKAAQLADDYRPYPVDEHGKLRFQYFSFTQVGAGDAGSTIELCKLPPGRVRVLPYLAKTKSSAFGAGRTLKIGHREYFAKSQNGDPSTAEDDDALATSIDVAAAGVDDLTSPVVLKYDFYSRTGVTLFATVVGGTIPDGATLEGVIPYIYE